MCTRTCRAVKHEIFFPLGFPPIVFTKTFDHCDVTVFDQSKSITLFFINYRPLFNTALFVQRDSDPFADDNRYDSAAPVTLGILLCTYIVIYIAMPIYSY